MNNPFFIIAVIALLLLGLVFTSMVFLIFQFLKFKTFERNKEIQNFNRPISTFPQPENQPTFCKNHPTIPAVGMCNICEETFCSSCIKNHKSLQFCLPHLEIFLTSNWTEVASILTTPHEPEKGMFLYDFKRLQWKEKSTPTYIQTQYKINVENDQIESCVVLFAQDNCVTELREEIEAINH